MINLEKNIYICENSVHVECPICGFSIQSDQLRKGEKKIVVRCGFCKEQFELTVTRRKHERHDTNIEGSGFCALKGNFQLTIVNISQGGFGFTAECSKMKINDSVKIRFPQDTQNKEQVTVTVQICHIDKEYVCGSLLLPDYSDQGSIKWVKSYCQTRSRNRSAKVMAS